MNRKMIKSLAVLLVLLLNFQSFAETIRYTYDDAGQLKRLINGAVQESYGHDNSGNLLRQEKKLFTQETGLISTFAGDGSGVYKSDGMLANRSSVVTPDSAAFDASGNLFVASEADHCVRKIDVNGIVTTIAGNGNPGYRGDGGLATSASLYWPTCVTVDGIGDVYIADSGNNCIRKIDKNGIISTFAGIGGNSGYGGDGGFAISALLKAPSAVTYDREGNVYISDGRNNRVRRVDTNGIITTVAGDGSTSFSGDGRLATNASLYGPQGIVIDENGTLFIADCGHNRIRAVDSNGMIRTVAGTGIEGYSGDGKSALVATLRSPCGLDIDNAGNLFISDTWNNRIRKVGFDGTISTVAGTGNSGYNGDGLDSRSADLYRPRGIAFDSSGDLYIADTDNHRIRMVSLSENQAAPGPPTRINAIIGDKKVILSFTEPENNGGSLIKSYTAISSPGGITTTGTENSLVISGLSNSTPYIFTIRATNGQKTGPSSIASNSVTLYEEKEHIITTVAGNGGLGTPAIGGHATLEPIARPYDIEFDSVNNMYITSQSSNRVYRIDHSGLFSVVAGTGTNGYSGDGGLAISAQLKWPSGIDIDNDGNLYIADTGNNCIRKVDNQGVITTVAGNGSSGYRGDGGLATLASLRSPFDVTIDEYGKLYIPDHHNHCIRMVDTNRIITTIAGTGISGYSGDGRSATSAQMYGPMSIRIDSIGNTYFSDIGNHCIRMINKSGIITTVAGTSVKGYTGDGCYATSAKLSSPWGIELDLEGNLLISDYDNNSIRRVDKNGIITTIAGSGIYGFSGDGEAPTLAMLSKPSGIVIDKAGNLYISDQENNRIRKIADKENMTSISGAPSDVIGSPGDSQATVSFTAPTDNGGSAITDYTVTSSPGGKTAHGTGSPITLTGLTNGTAYTFTVTATNSAGTSSASSASASVTPATVPGSPINVTAVGGNGKATVSFTAPASNGGSSITSYKVTSSPGGINATGTGSPIMVTGLTNGTNYTFTVTATNTAGTGAPSAASGTVKPAATVPGIPTGISAVPGNAKATISFTAPTDNGGSAITGYTVTASPGGKTATGIGSPITITGLTNGTAYTFTVKANNSVGSSPASAASASVIPATIPGAPTSVKAVAGNGKATITFVAPVINGGSPITNYTVTSSPGGKTANGTGSPITITGLTNGTYYTFTVKATNGVGTSAASSASNRIKPSATVPGAPTNVSAAAGNKQAIITFTAPAGNGGSAITGYTVTASPGGKTATSTGSPITITGLTNGTTYTFTVKAKNGVGTSPASAVSNGVKPAVQ